MIWNDEARIPKDQCLACDGYQLPARVERARALAVGHSSFVIRHSRAFTLVELLIVISIIAILSAMLLGVAATSAEQARGSRSKSMVAKINGLVMQQYDTYKDRRAPVQDTLPNGNPSPLRNLKGQARAAARLYALRELMLMEIPDRWSDVLLNSVENVSQPSDLGQPRYLAATTGSTFGGPTPLVEAYRRQYFAMLNAGVSKDDIISNESAECLYMFVMHATSDGEARGLFNESSIGDTDGDGAYEFLDGWGNPISFIRWPVGFESSKQNNAKQLDLSGANAWTEAASVDHDPFDVFRVDGNAFRVMPLIYSMGPNEQEELFRAARTPTWPSNAGGSFVGSYPKLSMYVKYDGRDDSDNVVATEYLGTPMNENNLYDRRAGTDNITNHNLTGE